MSDGTKEKSVIRLKPGTRAKVDQIAKLRRWKIGEAIDAIADDYLAREKQRRAKQSA